jgi:hypothetical protein
VDPRAYVFHAKLAAYPRVVRTVALTGNQTLEELHEMFRAEFGWDDPHLYSFWLSGRFWDGPETEYAAPFDLEESGAKSARTPLGEVGLDQGQRIAYLFDYGDNWEVEVTVAEIRDAGDASYPQVLERVGDAPPQYAPLDEDEEA